MFCAKRSLPLKRRLNHTSPEFSRIHHHRNNATSSAPPKSNGSVDATEVTHFDALASTWWDPHGSSRLLHLMNPLRHDFLSQCRSSHTRNTTPRSSLTYLDIGCGGGIFAESAARLPTTDSVTAIDPSTSVIAVARAHARRDPSLHQSSYADQNAHDQTKLPSKAATPLLRPKLTYLNTDIESFASSSSSSSGTPTQSPQQFDVVTLFEVLEHVNHPSAFLTSCLPLVRPGGWLVLSTIARTWTSWFTTKVVAEDLAGLVPRGTHDWNKYVQEEELRAWFAKRHALLGKREEDEWQTAEREVGGLEMRSQGVIYVPGIGWRVMQGGENWGNYFFGVRRRPLDS